MELLASVDASYVSICTASCPARACLLSFLLAFAIWNFSDSEHWSESYMVWRERGRLLSLGEIQISETASMSFESEFPDASRLVSCRRRFFCCSFFNWISPCLTTIDFFKFLQRWYVLFALVISSTTRNGFKVRTVTMKLWVCTRFRAWISDGQVFPKARMLAGQASTLSKSGFCSTCSTRAGQPWNVWDLQDFSNQALCITNKNH